MSDQTFEERETQDSHAADVAAGLESSEDEDAVGFPPAGIPRPEADDDNADTSRDADVAAAYGGSGGE